jgi:hypothetical protein
VQGERDYYSVEEAAAVLGTSPARVLQILTAGELEGLPPGATTEGASKVLLPVAPERDPAPDQVPPAEESPKDLESAPEPPEEAPAREEQPEAAAVEDLPRGDSAARSREVSAPSGWVSTQQARKSWGRSAGGEKRPSESATICAVSWRPSESHQGPRRAPPRSRRGVWLSFTGL